MHCFVYTSQYKMTSFTSSSEVLGLLLYGDEKRRVHFRIVDSVLPSGNQRRFGLTEYLYCEKHCTWHEQKNEAYVPVSEWSELVNYSQYVDVYSKPTIEQAISEKSNAVLIKEYATVLEPERKVDEAPIRKDAPLQQYCDDGYGNAIAAGFGCAPTGTPEQH